MQTQALPCPKRGRQLIQATSTTREATWLLRSGSVRLETRVSQPIIRKHMARTVASWGLDPQQETVQRLDLRRSAHRTTSLSASPTTMAVSIQVRHCRLRLVGTAMPRRREEMQLVTGQVAMGERLQLS